MEQCAPKGDVDRLYIKRQEGVRGMSSLEHVVRGKENSLCHYVLFSVEAATDMNRAQAVL